MLSLWRKWIAYPVGWVVVIILTVVMIGATSNLGADDSPPMHHFHARFTATKVDDEVHLHVTESIRDELAPSRLGIARTLIPHYDGQDLGISNITVEDPDGNPYPFEQVRLANGDIDLLIDRNDEPRNRYDHKVLDFLISYDVERTVGTAEGIQEIYLNVNGTEWANGFDEVSAELVIDPSLAGHLTGDMACYEGRAGSTRTCTITRDGNTFHAAIHDVRPFENLTIAVGLEPGTVSNPLDPIEGRSHGWWGFAGLVGIGLLALAISLLTRRAVRTPSRRELGIVTQFDPPDGLEPVLAADFLGVPERGAAAHLAWLVTEGHATLVSDVDAAPPGPESPLTAHARATHRAGLRVNWRADGMNGVLRSITEALFGGPGKDRSLEHPRDASALAEAQTRRDNALANRGLRKEITFGPLLLWCAYLAILGYGVYQVWIGVAGQGRWLLLAGVVGVMLVLWAFHLLPVHGRLTERGREVQRHLAGLERFVTISEGERIRWMNSVESAPRDEASRVDLYEKLLPWAIVFGAEDSWRQVLGDMYSRFPEREPASFRTLAGPAGWTRTYGARRRRRRRSQWDHRPNIGQGSLSRGARSFASAVGEASRGSSGGNFSTRSSGRGFGGGRSSRRGGSRGRGRSGGGRGGGGGRRR